MISDITALPMDIIPTRGRTFIQQTTNDGTTVVTPVGEYQVYVILPDNPKVAYRVPMAEHPAITRVKEFIRYESANAE